MPAETSTETERLWDIAAALHPDWEHVTWRDPINPAAFPLTSPYWADCESGAQLADLIRVEDLYHRGGWYIDSDMWMVRPLDSLCGLDGVAAYEDHLYIPNAVLGFRPGHPALTTIIDLAIERRFQGTWQAGVGVCTEVFTSSPDVTILPPGCFYAVHWRDVHRGFVKWSEQPAKHPYAFGFHKYAASWH